ncbi:hypothetical protein HU200_021746 [Digitaria exilis]|uniref:Phytocyanin domain-containing protein n=1 Tax=Digitaria exilis TaxID=1010633 RepID=A0A835KB85_9POAL|nr:hypothetical protein HU200_021746 [Digitaria exilis]
MTGGVAFILVSCAAVFLLAGSASATWHAQVFVVGGEPRGWAKPASPNEEETYNHWAARYRFHVGDFLRKYTATNTMAADFKYDKNDSVLVVSSDDYKFCGADRPLQRFDGGDTRFRLDHSGFGYFISGAPGHCDAGQRMAVRVMPQEGSTRPAPVPQAPASAMSPGGGEDEGGEFGPPWGAGSDNGGGGGSSSKPGHGSGGLGSASASMAPPHGVLGANGNKTSGAAASSFDGGGWSHVVVRAVVVLGAALLSLVVV